MSRLDLSPRCGPGCPPGAMPRRPETVSIPGRRPAVHGRTQHVAPNPRHRSLRERPVTEPLSRRSRPPRTCVLRRDRQQTPIPTPYSGPGLDARYPHWYRTSVPNRLSANDTESRFDPSCGFSSANSSRPVAILQRHTDRDRARPTHTDPDATPPSPYALRRSRHTTPAPAPRSGTGLITSTRPLQLRSVTVTRRATRPSPAPQPRSKRWRPRQGPARRAPVTNDSHRTVVRRGPRAHPAGSAPRTRHAGLYRPDALRSSLRLGKRH